ncbi:MAG: hypothetical protein K8R68_01150 [Bacteroidales bacterium]|nr:hypothetical protein [Bacteroidales bacterium]
MLQEKYELSQDSLPDTVIEALVTDIPIVKAIALIVENLESPQSITDSALRNIITQYLNEAAL